MVPKLDPKRARVLKKGNFSGKSVLYWMNRDKRVDDNWAIIAAQSIALKNKVPLIVCFQYLGDFPDSNIRQYGFLFKGLLELKTKLERLNIQFVLIRGDVKRGLSKIIEESILIHFTETLSDTPFAQLSKEIKNTLDKDALIYLYDEILPVINSLQSNENLNYDFQTAAINY